MICSHYCDFNETLTSHTSTDSGLPRCIMGTFPPAVLLFFIFFLFLLQLWKKRKIRAESNRHTLLSDEESPSVQEIVREEHKTGNSVLNCKRLDGHCDFEDPSMQFIANPSYLIHGDNRTSFLFTFQQFLHIIVLFIPVIDIITKATIVPDRIQGYVIVNDASMFITWMLAFFALRTECALYFKAHISRHSLGMLMFWTLAFVKENLSFISWHNPHWWFGRNTRIHEAEFGLFVSRYTIMALIFLFGMLGPGLYRPPISQVSVTDEPTFLEGSAVGKILSVFSTLFSLHARHQCSILPRLIFNLL